MAEEVYIARQDTLLAVKTEVEAGAKEATLNAVGTELETLVNQVSGKIGVSGDATGDTVFGKFNTTLNSTIGTPGEAPLNELISSEIQNNTTKRLRALFAPFSEKTIATSVVIDNTEYLIQGTTSQVIGSFTFSSDKNIRTVTMSASLKGSSSGYAYLYVTEEYSSPTLYSTLYLYADFSMGFAGSGYTDFLASNCGLKNGVTYYIHLVSSNSSTVAYCNNFSYTADTTSYDDKVVLNEQKSSNSTLSTVLGSFSFSEFDKNLPVYAKMILNLSHGRSGVVSFYIIVSKQYSTSTTYNNLNADTTKVYHTLFSLDGTYNNKYKTVTETEAFEVLEPNETYYVHLYSSSYTTYCNAVSVVFEKEFAPLSAVKSIQRGYVTISSTANTTITLAFVIPEKCSVNLSGGVSSSSSTNPAGAYVVSLTSTTLTLATSAGSSGSNVVCSWEVKEYY